MGKVLMSGGGGSVDLDVITAGAEHILVGTVGLDKEGEPLEGTMPNNGAVAPAALGAGGSYTIPEGYHNGSGKVTVQSLATLTSAATATAAQMLSPATAYVKGNLITGTIPNLNGGTYTPTTAAQTIGCAGYYMNHNITIAAIPSGYVNIGGTWTVFNQGTFAANMAFVPNLRVKYSWNMETVGPALSYGNRTYSGVTKYGLYMPGWDNYNNDGVPCAVFNRAIDFSLFKTMYVDVYDSLEQTAVFDVVFMDLTTKKSVSGVSTYGRTPDTGIGFFTLTIDLSSINTMYYFGIGSRRSGNYLFNIRLVHV